MNKVSVTYASTTYSTGDRVLLNDFLNHQFRYKFKQSKVLGSELYQKTLIGNSLTVQKKRVYTSRHPKPSSVTCRHLRPQRRCLLHPLSPPGLFSLSSPLVTLVLFPDFCYLN